MHRQVPRFASYKKNTTQPQQTAAACICTNTGYQSICTAFLRLSAQSYDKKLTKM